jgi:phenylalanyl-tRNA synthetase beta chain
VRRELAALGYQETINFSFVEERWERELAANADPIRVLNPIAAPLAVMRSSLIGSLVEVLRYNLARKAARVRVFEIGRVFMRDPDVADGDDRVAGVHQPTRVAALAFGAAQALQWSARERAVDFFDIKGDIEALFGSRIPVFSPAPHPALHPGRSARIEIDGRIVGHVGELHPRWRQSCELPAAPMVFEVELDALLERDVPVYRPIPRQQSVWRDVAFVLSEEARHDAVMAAIADDPLGLIRSATLFDIYRPPQANAEIGPGEHSMAVRIELLDNNATLTDERIDAAMAAVVARLRSVFGARLRG